MAKEELKWQNIDADDESIVEHVAGVEDYQVALATYRAALGTDPTVYRSSPWERGCFRRTPPWASL
jgi:hypothetical protein